MKTQTDYVPGNCKYEHVFIVFMGEDIKRPCIKKDGHKGNHIVREPKENKLLEVWQK